MCTFPCSHTLYACSRSDLPILKKEDRVARIQSFYGKKGKTRVISNIILQCDKQCMQKEDPGSINDNLHSLQEDPEVLIFLKVELQQFDTKPLIKVRVCKMHCISWLGVGVCHSLHTCTYTCVCTTTHNTYRRPGSAKLHQTSKYTHLYPKSRIATIRHQTTDKS